MASRRRKLARVMSSAAGKKYFEGRHDLMGNSVGREIVASFSTEFQRNCLDELIPPVKTREKLLIAVIHYFYKYCFEITPLISTRKLKVRSFS